MTDRSVDKGARFAPNAGSTRSAREAPASARVVRSKRSGRLSDALCRRANESFDAGHFTDDVAS